jgi:hypothetical protein
MPSSGDGHDTGVELARYTISAGQRVFYGQRVLGIMGLGDVPANGRGRRYVIEHDLTSIGQRSSCRSLMRGEARLAVHVEVSGDEAAGAEFAVAVDDDRADEAWESDGVAVQHGGVVATGGDGWAGRRGRIGERGCGK